MPSRSSLESTKPVQKREVISPTRSTAGPSLALPRAIPSTAPECFVSTPNGHFYEPNEMDNITPRCIVRFPTFSYTELPEMQDALEAERTGGTLATHYHGPPPEMVHLGCRGVLARHGPASHHCIEAPAAMQEARQTEEATPATVRCVCGRQRTWIRIANFGNMSR